MESDPEAPQVEPEEDKQDQAQAKTRKTRIRGKFRNIHSA